MSYRKLLAGGISALLIIGAPLLVLAGDNTYKTRKIVSVPSGETINGDFFAAGEEVEISGTVQGDLYAAGVCFWEMCTGCRFPILPRWRARYAPGVTHNTEHVFSLCVPAIFSPSLAAWSISSTGPSVSSLARATDRASGGRAVHRASLDRTRWRATMSESVTTWAKCYCTDRR